MGIVEHPWQSFVETYKTYIYIIQLEVSWNWGTPNHPELVYFSIETHGFGDIQFTRLLKVEQLMFAYDGWGGTGLFAVGCGEMEHPSIHHRFWLKKGTKLGFWPVPSPQLSSWKALLQNPSAGKNCCNVTAMFQNLSSPQSPFSSPLKPTYRRVAGRISQFRDHDSMAILGT